MNNTPVKTGMDIRKEDYPHIIAMAQLRWLRIDTYVGYATCDNEEITRLEIRYSEYTKNRRVAEEFMRTFRSIFLLGPTINDLKAINPDIDLDSFDHNKVFSLIVDRVGKEKESDIRYGYIPIKIGTTLNKYIRAYNPNLWFSGEYMLERSDGVVLNVQDDEMIRKVAEAVKIASKELTAYFQSPAFIEDLRPKEMQELERSESRGKLIIHQQKRRRSSRTKQNKKTKQ